MFKNFWYNINIFSQLSNLLYSSRVIKELVYQRAIEDYYYLTDASDKKVRNPVMKGNTLILKMPLPPKLDEFDIETYITDHCKVLMNSLLALNLYGIVRFGKKIYINDNFSENEEDNDDYGVILLTVSPDYRKFFITLAIYTILISSIVYYVFFYHNFRF